MRLSVILLAALFYGLANAGLLAFKIIPGGLMTVVLAGLSYGLAWLIIPEKKSPATGEKDHIVDVNKISPPVEEPVDPVEESPDPIEDSPVHCPSRLRLYLPYCLAGLFFLVSVALTVCLCFSLARSADLQQRLYDANDEYSVGFADAEAKLLPRHQAELDQLAEDHRQALHDKYYEGYNRGFEHGQEKGYREAVLEYGGSDAYIAYITEKNEIP